MISLSEKLQAMKLGEMRATRELTEVKEKNNYLSRLLRQQNENLKNLEEKVAEQESKLHKREEEFRRAENERMRRFFNARFDDVGGVLSSNNKREDTGFGGASAGPRSRSTFERPKEAQSMDATNE
jgi:chromosome segregation ATPase